MGFPFQLDGVHKKTSGVCLHDQNRLLCVKTTRGIPDPEGAAILLESLDKITDNKSLEIDTQHLRKQGAALRTRMEKILQSLRSQQQQPQEEGAQDAGRIRDGVMYG
jgi:uncharacterized protein